MPRPKALVTRTLLPDALDIIRAAADLEVWPDEAPPSISELRGLVADVDGILTTIMDRVDADLLDAAPNVRAISQLAVGLDNVDVAEATRRGIPVGYTPGVLAKSTADLGFALLLGAARRTSESERWVRAGGWEIQFHPTHWLGQDVHEACLGIVGLGQIGREIARRARGFDMDIVYHSRTRYPDVEAEYGVRYAEFPDLLAQADFVILSVPLTPETHHLISGPQLAMMKPSGILINVSRGPGRRPGGPLPGPPGPPHRARRPGRHRAGTHRARRPAAHVGQPRDHSPHRQRSAAHPPQHHETGRPQPSRRVAGPTHGSLRQPRSSRITR